jgi:L-ascorbate metabolism protein UlaG (beta-lactamase superfamily)
VCSRGSVAVADDRVTLRFLGHATVLIEVDGVRVLTDPFLRPRLGPLERHGPLPDPAWYSAVDVVLISHGHRDHFDPDSLAAISGEPVVVVPRGLGSGCRDAVRGEVVEVAAGASWARGDLLIRAVSARHWISPGAPRAEPIGYVIEGSSRVYFAGDTGRFDELGALRGGVDVALLPVWTWGPHRGPGHLGPRSAAEVAAVIRPALAIPIHWATLYPRHPDIRSGEG